MSSKKTGFVWQGLYLIHCDMTTDVLAVIYAPLEKYPPSLNQVALLTEAGLKVAVIDSSHPNIDCLPFRGHYPVRRIRGTRYTEQYREPLANSAVRLWRLFQFKATLQKFLCALRPKIVIAYDPYAMYLVGSVGGIKPRPLIVWHFHELPAFASNKRMTGMVGRTENFIRRQPDTADVWIVPDANRAHVLSQFVRGSHDQFIVMNCPRRLEQLPRGQLRQRLDELRFGSQQIVLFQGALARSRCLETLIASMKKWPLSAGLVLLGPVAHDYRARLTRFAADAGCVDRVLFLEPVPYGELFTYTVEADVGCCLIDGNVDQIWQLSAGAVNKRFEYMAAGVPQVTNHEPGLKEMVADTNAGLLVEPRDSSQVGDAIATLLNSDATRVRMGNNARNAHLTAYNYEAQFAGALKHFVKWVSGGREVSR